MKKTFLLAGAAILFAAGAAQAADIVDAPVSDWSGFYAGINAGYGGGTFDYPANLSIPEFRETGLDYDFGADITASGFFGGLQAGWNYQIDNIVLGVEGDINLSNIESELELYSDTASASLSGGSEVDWYGTARLRAGFLATPDLLLYATGGLAWGSVTAQYDLDLNQFNQLVGEFIPTSDDTSESHMGWTVGGGLEYRLTENIGLFTDARYMFSGVSRLPNNNLMWRYGLRFAF